MGTIGSAEQWRKSERKLWEEIGEAHRKFLHRCICEEDAGHLPIASPGQREKQGEQEALSVSRECVIPETGF